MIVNVMTQAGEFEYEDVVEVQVLDGNVLWIHFDNDSDVVFNSHAWTYYTLSAGDYEYETWGGTD